MPTATIPFPLSPPAVAPTVGPAPTAYWRSVGQWLLLVLGHMALLTVIYSVLYCFGVLHQLPSDKASLRWDSGWYQSIRSAGYSYDENAQSNVAFFPLFPYFWRLTGLGALGISIVNMLSAAAGIALLVAALPCTRRQGLLLASVPVLFFTLVPYTEALFYLFGALLLVGLHRQQMALLLLGLLGCCLARASATFFVPALFFAELVAWLASRATGAALRNLALGLLVIALGVGSVSWLQHAQTGEWLGFYKVQRHWYHWWRMPELPLTSTAGILMLWLDAISIGTALGALLVFGYLLISRVEGFFTKATMVAPSRAVIFSLIYCACAGGFTVFQQGGDIANSSRYILGTPFFTVLLWAAWQQAHRWRTWLLAGAVLLVIIYFLGYPNQFDGFWPGQATWYFGLTAGYVAAMLAAGSTFSRWPLLRELSAVIYLFNVVLQALLLNWFLEAVWLG